MPARDEASDLLVSESDRLVFEALWTGVINDWERDDRHVKFLDHVRKIGAFSEAAARYAKLRDDPERGPEARKRLSAIAVLATSELLATRTKVDERKVPRWLWALAIAVCAGLMGWAGWYYLGFARPRAPQHPSHPMMPGRR